MPTISSFSKTHYTLEPKANGQKLALLEHDFHKGSNTVKVVLNEGFTIWHPRLEKDTSRYYLLEEEDVFFSDMQWEEESIYEAPSLYPNPAQDYFQVSAHEGFSEGKIYDINGKVLKRFKLERDTPVFVGDLIKGIYICRIEAPQWSYSYPLKFVKL